MAQLTSDPTATRQKYDEAWESNFFVTIGRLIKRFTPYLNGDDELEEDLQLALAIRNPLAHHYFWDNAAKATAMRWRSSRKWSGGSDVSSPRTPTLKGHRPTSWLQVSQRPEKS